MVEPRLKDYAKDRTDKRGSESYAVYPAAGGRLLSRVEFHEGCAPRDGMNGLLLEDLLAICHDRLELHQAGPFRCSENALAATKVEEALLWIHRRRAKRKARQVSGTQEV